MKEKITCFKLNWYDSGMCWSEEVVQEEVTIYRNECYMVIKELNRYGVICSCETIDITKENVERFFEFLEENCDEWEYNYGIKVYDGSEWKVRMWYSSHNVKKVCGTVEYPPNGKKIEKYIRSFIADGKSNIVPVLFGLE